MKKEQKLFILRLNYYGQFKSMALHGSTGD